MDFTGITFNGKHSSDFNILRVSDGVRYQDTLVPDFEDYTESVPGGVGSYYYGSEDKQKEFSLNFAFDKMTEKNLREVKQWLGVKKPCDLIFDEWPYKAYSAKISSPPSFEIICFMEKGQRIYKGEISVDMICYYPYARSVHKDLASFRDEQNYVADTTPVVLNWVENKQLEQISFVPPATTWDFPDPKDYQEYGGVKGYYCNYDESSNINNSLTGLYPVYVKRFDPNYINIMITDVKQLNTNTSDDSLGFHLTFTKDDGPSFFTAFAVGDNSVNDEKEISLVSDSSIKAKIYFHYNYMTDSNGTTGAIEVQFALDQLPEEVQDEPIIHHVQIYGHSSFQDDWRNTYSTNLSGLQVVLNTPVKPEYSQVTTIVNNVNNQKYTTPLGEGWEESLSQEEEFFSLGNQFPKFTLSREKDGTQIKETKYRKIIIDPSMITTSTLASTSASKGIFSLQLSEKMTPIFCNYFPVGVNDTGWYIKEGYDKKSIYIATTFTSLNSFKKWLEDKAIYIWVETESVIKKSIDTSFYLSEFTFLTGENSLYLENDSIPYLGAQMEIYTKGGVWGNIDEWRDASGMLDNLSAYDSYGDGQFRLYNPGDLNSDYILSQEITLVDTDYVPLTNYSGQKNEALGTYLANTSTKAADLGFVRPDENGSLQLDAALSNSNTGFSFKIHMDQSLSGNNFYYRDEFLKRINLIDYSKLESSYYLVSENDYSITNFAGDRRYWSTFSNCGTIKTDGAKFILVFKGMQKARLGFDPIFHPQIKFYLNDNETATETLGFYKRESGSGIAVGVKISSSSSNYSQWGLTAIELPAGNYTMRMKGLIYMDEIAAENLCEASSVLENFPYQIYLFELPQDKDKSAIENPLKGKLCLDGRCNELYWETQMGRKIPLNSLFVAGKMGSIPQGESLLQVSYKNLRGEPNKWVNNSNIEYDYLYY